MCSRDLAFRRGGGAHFHFCYRAYA